MWKPGCALAIACAVAGSARADTPRDRAPLAQLAALYEPIGKLAGGERVDRACAEAARLHDASQALPDDKVPAGAAVDVQGWARAAGAVQAGVTALVGVCKAPDRKRKRLNEIQTADQVVATVDHDLRVLFDVARPRTLPPAVKAFKATLAATKFPSSSFCSRIAKLNKQVGGLASPPARADAAGWLKAAAEVKTSTASLQCGKDEAADEQIAARFVELGDQLNALVLLVPPN